MTTNKGNPMTTELVELADRWQADGDIALLAGEGDKHCVLHNCATELRALASRAGGPEVRFNPDGSLDEVIGDCSFHLEQMSPTHWWMQVGPHMVNLTAKGKIAAHFGENEVAPEPVGVG